MAHHHHHHEFMETQKLISMVKEALEKYQYPLTAKNIKVVIQKEHNVVLPTGSINSILYSNSELFEKIDKTNTIYPPLWIRKN
nr:Chain A, I73R [African swine fever virus]7VWV_B Chain B, I73R [African swine fever virus]